ncbi:hypothetical protein Fcan01_01103 [Folsomia candida]|uniref:Uncharacterized protein n=1 Tax=Folsomia candida TaxID=158441 RepID=A0A226F1J2_FOLCA|nr:hypothetical protein Fcan01_01103 [Folsomia candida]
MKLMNKISIPSLTPFHALKRFVFLSEYLYPQFITWNRITWVPHPTPRNRLLPAFLLTFLLIVATVHLVYFGLMQITSKQKDPDVTITSGFVLSICFFSFTIGISISISFIFKRNQLCLVLRNLLKLKRAMFPRGTLLEHFNVLGLYLHGLLISIITSCLAPLIVPVVLDKIDPTYFWFRNFECFCPVFKTVIRSVLISLLCMHTIKFATVIPPPLTLVCVVSAASIVGMGHWMLPLFANVNTESKEFLKCRNVKIKSALGLRQLKGCGELRI